MDKMPDNLKLSVNGVEINGPFFFHITFAESHLEIEESFFFSVKKLQYYLQLKFRKGMNVSEKINLDFLLVTLTWV